MVQMGKKAITTKWAYPALMAVVILIAAARGPVARAQDLATPAQVEERQRLLLESNPVLELPRYPRFFDTAERGVELDEPVRFRQHFKPYRYSDRLDQNADLRRGLYQSAGGTLSLVLAVKMRRMNHTARHALLKMNDSKAINARRFMRRLQGTKAPGRLLLASGIYLLADALTGVAIVAYGHRPVYFANAPGLAGYMVRKSAEASSGLRTNFMDTMPDAVAQELNDIKHAVLGEPAN